MGCREEALHVFTFSRLENWVNVLRLSPPATDTQRFMQVILKEIKKFLSSRPQPAEHAMSTISQGAVMTRRAATTLVEVAKQFFSIGLGDQAL